MLITPSSLVWHSAQGGLGHHHKTVSTLWLTGGSSGLRISQHPSSVDQKMPEVTAAAHAGMSFRLEVAITQDALAPGLPTGSWLPPMRRCRSDFFASDVRGTPKRRALQPSGGRCAAKRACWIDKLAEAAGSIQKMGLPTKDAWNNKTSPPYVRRRSATPAGRCLALERRCHPSPTRFANGTNRDIAETHGGRLFPQPSMTSMVLAFSDGHDTRGYLQPWVGEGQAIAFLKSAFNRGRVISSAPRRRSGYIEKLTKLRHFRQSKQFKLLPHRLRRDEDLNGQTLARHKPCTLRPSAFLRSQPWQRQPAAGCSAAARTLGLESQRQAMSTSTKALLWHQLDQPGEPYRLCSRPDQHRRPTMSNFWLLMMAQRMGVRWNQVRRTSNR